jgi:hypothetical protein
MAKKSLIVVVLAIVIAGGAFAQEEHKHESLDVLMGINYGMGITPNIGRLFSGDIPSGNYALTFDFGLTTDFYALKYLSFSTGIFMHPDIYVTLDRDKEVENFTDVAAVPLCLTIPFAVHVNIPYAEWLYMGIGVSLNYPIFSILDSVVNKDTRGPFFIGLPMDLGFDFVKPGGGGMRFFFRVTPEFHEKGTAVPIGFVWQVWNWKLFGKKGRRSEAENRYETVNASDEKAERPARQPEVTQSETRQPARQVEAEKKPADTKTASVPAEDSGQRRAAGNAVNAAKSRLEKAEANKAEAEARLASAKEAVALAEAELARATAALSALDSR